MVVERALRTSPGAGRRAPRLLVALSGAAIALAAAPARGQGAPSPAAPAAGTTVVAITGSVFDTLGAPVADAEVALLGTELVRRTDPRGEFRFPATRAAQYVLRARRLGYVTKVILVDGSAGDTLTLALNLEPAAPVMPSVVVREKETPQYVGRLAGFYERMRTGAAPASSFVTREEIDRLNPRRTSDIVKVRGARATACLNGKVYVDGVLSLSPAQLAMAQAPLPMPGPAGQAQNARLSRPVQRPRPRVRPDEAVDVVPPDQIEAMEIYRGAAETPAQFDQTAAQGMASGCTILIWTRVGGGPAASR